MGTEIESKQLLRDLNGEFYATAEFIRELGIVDFNSFFLEGSYTKLEIEQFYLNDQCSDKVNLIGSFFPKCNPLEMKSLRLRKQDDAFYVNSKGPSINGERGVQEFEKSLRKREYRDLLKRYPFDIGLYKTRVLVPFRGFVLEVDFFKKKFT